jgi:hypothetical protein
VQAYSIIIVIHPRSIDQQPSPSQQLPVTLSEAQIKPTNNSRTSLLNSKSCITYEILKCYQDLLVSLLFSLLYKSLRTLGI